MGNGETEGSTGNTKLCKTSMLLITRIARRLESAISPTLLHHTDFLFHPGNIHSWNNIHQAMGLRFDRPRQRSSPCFQLPGHFRRFDDLSIRLTWNSYQESRLVWNSEDLRQLRAGLENELLFDFSTGSANATGKNAQENLIFGWFWKIPFSWLQRVCLFVKINVST